jgi:CRISPR-associated protein Cas2
MMKRYDFVLSYDISDPKRLKKIAKIVERKALRIQYSIYVLFDTTKDDVTRLLDNILNIYDEKTDDIRVYKIKDRGIHLGSAVDLDNPFDFFA